MRLKGQVWTKGLQNWRIFGLVLFLLQVWLLNSKQRSRLNMVAKYKKVGSRAITQGNPSRFIVDFVGLLRKVT